MNKSNKSQNKSVVLPREKSAAESGYGQHRLYTGQEEKRKSHSPSGAQQCTECGAVSFKKHWFMDIDKKNDFLAGHLVEKGLCPGCKRLKEKDYQGEVVIEGVLADRDAVIELIKHAEGKCWHDNPSSRIASIVETDGLIKINTTSKWLAVRIGKELHKSHKGNLEIKPSEGEDYVRVYWSL